MSVSCGDPKKLIEVIKKLYSNKVEESRPSNLCTKLTFESGFIINVFDNGTVNFQGKPDKTIENNIKSNIDIINNL
ncbi:hypothetical protein ROV31_03505 [Pasteurella multocida]|uniref:hypothetical protein n=1 Tax=Pasteurella multocida TaxID=747 RepID=UPI0012EAADD9|nr:hypothetical protein [Pasteurella multocida]MEB3469637.1 hypothetical protein [Pasteurella multocida]NNH92626.1 hypothetical protein [Pasteurella multocida]QGV29106.1 hypothetical protein EEX22_05570 [Pasteurella multocida]HDR0633688.1 hypothetical protein [Pasteurella multocida]HDR0671494.1 hypothetical protein [Pasteurella multocida]